MGARRGGCLARRRVARPARLITSREERRQGASGRGAAGEMARQPASSGDATHGLHLPRLPFPISPRTASAPRPGFPLRGGAPRSQARCAVLSMIASMRCGSRMVAGSPFDEAALDAGDVVVHEDEGVGDARAAVEALQRSPGTACPASRGGRSNCSYTPSNCPFVYTTSSLLPADCRNFFCACRIVRGQSGDRRLGVRGYDLAQQRFGQTVGGKGHVIESRRVAVGSLKPTGR